MELPLQIVFREVPHSNALETVIRDRAAKLERYCDRIISCRVIVREPHRRRQQGDLFAVTIDITIPGAELAVGYNGGSDQQTHENAYVAIRDAFSAMERRLKETKAMRRREIKKHVDPKHVARVTRFFPQDAYGFITTSDGREIYFHSHAVINGGIEGIRVGTEVKFVEELGDKGPQATTVECLRPPETAGS